MQLPSGPWPARITWLVLPLAVGGALGDALDGASRAVQVVGSVQAWGAWAAVLVAVLLPRTVSLTVLRTVAPLALVVAVWAAVVGEQGGADVLAVAGAALAAVVAFLPTVGEAFVNGSSYGDERRMPLRVPGPLVLGPLPLTWLATVAAAVAAPLLLAAGQWVAGAGLLVFGVPAAVVSARALHGLSRRWLVFVPAGVVVHDHHALADPVLFPRARIARFGPAPADEAGDALDLTVGAYGLALQLVLHEPVEVAPRTREELRLQSVHRVLVTPTRPGAVLREAGERRIPVG